MKETLDEAADKYEKTFGLDANGTESIDFLEGAKWQQERSYSEEELLEVVNWYLNDFLDDALGLNGEEAEKKVEHLKGNGLTKEILKYWFEQFKKK